MFETCYLSIIDLGFNHKKEMGGDIYFLCLCWLIPRLSWCFTSLRIEIDDIITLNPSQELRTKSFSIDTQLIKLKLGMPLKLQKMYFTAFL